MTEYTSLAERVDAIEVRLDRIAQVQEQHSDTLAAIIRKMDERSEVVDKRFVAVDKRFDGLEIRLGNMERLLTIIAEAVTKGSPPSNNA